MNLQHIGVVGAGSMGNGIAQICALADIHVTLLGVTEDALQKAVAAIGKNLDHLIAKGELSEAQKLAALNNIHVQTDFTSLYNAQLVIEAATENFDWKLQVLQQIEKQVSSQCVIASTSSSFSVTHLAISLNQPERVIGLHFFNPESVMGLIEVIRGLQTSDATHALVLDLAAALGKTAITAGNHRILVPIINDAIQEFQDGLTSAKDIDARMRLGCDQPIGPLALADLIGLDTVLTILEAFYNGFNDSNYRPAPLLKEMVAAGYLGLKTGHGFHAYT
ncbi:3-hydroxybutyryl-CoA dehydrogenase [Pseudomonas jessenii]|uniref:3-hydroxybutyryl-CoA dehydrogenase n=1 Tax=Pseudomonas jessenii TaxID=77298 RepID=A0A2W0EVT8_PSEJE|nr:3-hydroxyacyl-CoA dehydrogenase NAD-binding domain-containing protein [Pseudomonas jessenii]PYY72500.1 3-hydroxybutyryl-CoA dehydrogenase [Pseudomonas jessenii]